MTIFSSKHAQRTAILLTTLASAQLTGKARAEQFVLIDSTFTFTEADAQPNSHYYGSVLNPDRPVDWTAPVDYRNGSVHIRTEVIDKPAGSEVTQWVLCYIAEAGQGDHYGCTGSGTYTEAGVYERDESMHSWWQNDIIDWTRGINEMHLVMKDADGSLGFTSWRPDPEHFFPTTVRITMIQVSEGDAYDPSMFPGTEDAPDAGVGEPDAGVNPGLDGGAPVMSDAGPTLPGDDSDGSGAAPGDADGQDGQDGGLAEGATGATTSGCAVRPMASSSRLFGLGLLGLLALRRRRAVRGALQRFRVGQARGEA
jgi:hypothetical protein